MAREFFMHRFTDATLALLRFMAGRRPQTIELPLIMGGQSGQVEIETWEGETLMVVGEEPE